MAKITKATFKSFIKKNAGSLFVKVESSFDGMVDCVMSVKDEFSAAKAADQCFENNLGISGVWLVHSAGNWFNAFKNEEYEGISVSNCCGSCIVAKKIVK
jgi:hypothetical protein